MKPDKAIPEKVEDQTIDQAPEKTSDKTTVQAPDLPIQKPSDQPDHPSSIEEKEVEVPTTSPFNKIETSLNPVKTSKHFISRILPFLKNSSLAIFHFLIFLFSKKGLITTKNKAINLTTFMLILSLYIFNTLLVHYIFGSRLFPRKISDKLQPAFSRFYIKAIKLLDKQVDTISRIDLIELSLRNMESKKTRTIVTIGGMAIGIGAIVFLVSVGYGLQQLVISRVARLDEMKQADVYPQTGGTVKLTDKSLSDFKDIENVELALPLISVVGRVNYQDSLSDMAVYGVTADYLKQSAIKPVQGKIFDSNDIAMSVSPTGGEVAGAETTIDQLNFSKTSVPTPGAQDNTNFQFTIQANKWIRVRSGSSAQSQLLGYTKNVGGSQSGQQVLGASYPDTSSGQAKKDSTGEWQGQWITTEVLLWKQEDCDKTNPDCVDGKYIILRDKDGSQVKKTGYFAEVNIDINQSPTLKQASVLGVSTSAELANSGSTLETQPSDASGSGSLGFVNIASESAATTDNKVKTVALASNTKKEAIVNESMLKILGLKDTEAVGKTFNVSFVVVGDLLSDNKDRVESSPTAYTIIGVTIDDKTPVFYVPFIDLRQLGVVNYSQIKVVAKNPASLSKVRQQIEARGYLTRSVADTVSQINSLFATVRAVLALLGTVALAVAALGMFNTLTVSLLERTHEVGLMKAMGMKSTEIRELFLTESMLMGLFGGLLGILLGFLAGKAVSLLLSIFAIGKGLGWIDIAYIPIQFLLLVVGLSLVVGVLTGFYPARRATKISALNALRYE